MFKNKISTSLVHPSVGDIVYLKQCAFTDRHKVQNTYDETPYVVVWHNNDKDVYRIRPVHGGASKVVHRTLIRMSVLEEDTQTVVNNVNSDTSSSEEEYEIRLQLPSSDEVKARSGVSTRVVPPLRRSQRATKGKHSNPFNMPKSAKL